MPGDHLAVGGHRLPRPHDEPVAHLEVGDREPALDVHGIEHGDILGPHRR